MQRKAQNDQQSNTENDQEKGSASDYLRRYRRGRHATKQQIQLFLNRTATIVADAAKSKIGFFTERAAGIADNTRSKINPFIADMTSTATEVTKSTVDPLSDKATDLARAARMKIEPATARMTPAFRRAMNYRISPLAGGLALSMALGGVGLAAASYDPASAAPAHGISVAAATGPALTDAADGATTDGATTGRAATDRTAAGRAATDRTGTDRTSAGNAASRSRNRTPATRSGTSAQTGAQGAPAGSPATPPAPAPSPTTPAPVGGLSQTEMNNAIAIVRAGQQMNLPRRAFVVAIATALQESHLRNLANYNLPASLNHANEGVGSDYDSVGLFQQRPNWGTIDQLMDPMESARRFYQALVAIPGWDQLDVTVAAQQVQGSAFPDAYAKWQGLAEQIVDAIN